LILFDAAENILLDDKENVKLSDFGLSRFLQRSDKFILDPSGPIVPLFKEYWKNPSEERIDEMTATYNLMLDLTTMTNYTEDKATHSCKGGHGTMGYIAPEIRLNKPYKLAVYIWSAGATLFHMLTGWVLI